MDYNKFEPLIGKDWGKKLQPFIESKEMGEIYKFLRREKARGRIICPDSRVTYRAFRETPYKDLKVIFFAQNPYPWFKNDVMVADGIALSCSNTKVLQPSLDQFYDGIEDDLCGGLDVAMVKNPDLSYLCNQGIMMLNTSLTVEKDKPGSQVELWLPFMRYLIEEVLNDYGSNLIFVLSGKCSMFLERYINPIAHRIIKIEHPAAAAHEFRKWRHENVFTKINKLLKEYYNFSPVWFEEVPF